MTFARLFTGPHTGFTGPHTGFTGPQTGFTGPHTGFTAPQAALQALACMAQAFSGGLPRAGFSTVVTKGLEQKAADIEYGMFVFMFVIAL